MRKSSKLMGTMLLFLLSINLFATSLQEDNRSFPEYKNKTTINSASELDYPPYSIVSPDGKADGFSVELMRAALKSMGKDVDFKVGQWSIIKDELAKGKLDTLPLVGRTPEREALYDFTIPYIQLFGALIVRSDNKDIKNIRDLKGKELITMRGDNAEEFAIRNGITEHITTTASFEQALRLLSSGKGDAVLIQKYVGEKLLEKLNIPNLKMLPETVSSFRQDFSFAVTSGNKELLAILNEGLANTKADGTYDKLYQKWFDPPDKYTLTHLLWIAFVILCSAALLMGAIIFTLHYRRLIYSRSELQRQVDKAVLEAKDSEVGFQYIFEHSPIGKSITKPSGEIRVNHAFCKMLGYSEDELKNKKWQEITHPDDIETTQKIVELMIKGEQEVVRFTKRYLHKNGSVIWADVSTSLRRDEYGNPVYFMTSLLDISKQKESQWALEKSKTELDKALEATNYLYDILHTITRINRVLISDMQVEELIIQSCNILAEHGIYRLAWVGFLDEYKIQIAASSQDPSGYTNQLKLSISPQDPSSIGPSAQCIIQNKTIVTQSFDVDYYANWKVEASKAGLGSSISLPLRVSANEKPFGVLNIYSSQETGFVKDEIDMLETLAGDIGFAISARKIELEHKKMNHTLKQSEEKFRTIFESSQDALILQDKDGFIDCNKRTLELFAAKDKTDFIALHPADLSATYQSNGEDSLTSANRQIDIAMEQGSNYFEWMSKRLNGELFPSDVLLTAFDYQGKRIIQATVRDTSERYEARRTSLILRKFFDNTNEGMTIADGYGFIKAINPAFSRITGYTLDEVKGQNPRILQSGEHSQKFYKKMWRDILEKGRWEGEIYNKRKNGEIYPEWLTITPIHGNNGEIENFVAVFLDLTMIKANQNKINEQEHIISSQSRFAVMGEMISMIAHQWRQPITAIGMGANNMLIDIELEDIDAEAFKKHLETINTQVQFLSQTIDDFRNFVKPQTSLVTVNILMPLEKAIRLVDKSLENNNIKLIIDSSCVDSCIDSKYDMNVNINESEIEQVILVVINNAKDVLLERGVKNPVIKISCGLGREEGFAMLEICDNGGGVPEDMMTKIFEPYFTTKSSKNGTGLGLYIAKSIMQKYQNGAINVENRDGGACFTIRLPIKKEPTL